MAQKERRIHRAYRERIGIREIGYLQPISYITPAPACAITGSRRGSLETLQWWQGRTHWYYRSLVKAFSKGEPNELIQELDRIVAEIERISK